MLVEAVGNKASDESLNDWKSVDRREERSAA